MIAYRRSKINRRTRLFATIFCRFSRLRKLCLTKLEVWVAICYNDIMKKAVLRSALIVVVLVAVLSAAGCAYYVDGTDVSGYIPVTLTTYAYFDCETSVNVYVASEDEKERLTVLWSEKILPSLAAAETSLSCYSAPDEGAVARFNAAAPGERVEVDVRAYEAVKLCLRVYAETDGAFNPATARSLDLWGFTDRFLNGAYAPSKEYDRADPHSQLPEQKYVTAFAELAEKFDGVTLEEDGSGFYVVKPEDGFVTVDGVEYTLALELGGIGKGVAADEVAALLKENGFEFGYVSVGGSSLVMLANAARMTSGKEGLFDVSVIDPYNGGHYFRHYCRDVAVSTSGNYRNSYIVGGRTYSHIIGKDGVPYDTGVVTASLFGPSAALCDAYTTAMCVMGMAGGEASDFATKLKNYRYVLIYETNEPTIYTNLSGENLRGYAEVRG